MVNFKVFTSFDEILAFLSQKTFLHFKLGPFNSIFLLNCSLNLTCKPRTKFFYGIRNPCQRKRL